MGTLSIDGYLNISIDYVIYRAHRLAWLFMTGEDPGPGIDHINGDPLDNRWCNLRKSTQQQNLLNKRVQSNNKLQIKGVHLMRNGSFRSSVTLNGKTKHLGTFETAAEAKAAYDVAAKIIHGDFFRS